MSDTHELKCHPAPFKATRNGYKNFELRRDDGRGFKLGDTLVLREWDPNGGVNEEEAREANGSYTGHSVTVEVTYIVRAPKFGLTGKMCCMSTKLIEGGAR